MAYLCTMKISAGQLAALVSGTLEGDPEILLERPSKIEEAVPGSVCFLANPKYEHYLYDSKASLVIVQDDFVPRSTDHPALLRVPNVYQTVSQLLGMFEEGPGNEPEIHASAVIHRGAKLGKGLSIGACTVVEEGAEIGENCRIGPQVYLGKNVKLGHSVTIHPGVRIYRDCVIGDRVILHANCVIGSDGFGFAPLEDGSFKKIAQIGNVVIESDVEIGANTCIDRGTMGSTLIGQGSKLDNLIQIAHNVQVGSHTAIAAQVGIAGSARIGSRCMIGGQVGIAGHLTIADRSVIQAQSGIASTIEEEGKKWYGSPAMDYFTFLRVYNEFKKLPQIAKKLREMEADWQEYSKNHKEDESNHHQK